MSKRIYLGLFIYYVRIDEKEAKQFIVYAVTLKQYYTTITQCNYYTQIHMETTPTRKLLISMSHQLYHELMLNISHTNKYYSICLLHEGKLHTQSNYQILKFQIRKVQHESMEKKSEWKICIKVIINSQYFKRSLRNLFQDVQQCHTFCSL